MIRGLPFLTARWSNLALITYDVDPRQLLAHVPPGCALDTLDNRAFVSLVAFDFLDTRVLGVKWPGFVNFPEINLRYYVRGPDARRGVAFIKELVPHRFVAYIARRIYNEPYEAVPMRSSTTIDEDGTVRVEHVARVAGRDQTIRVSGSGTTALPEPGCREHFFKEHEWGYGVTRDRRLITYHVSHPTWSVYCNPRIDLLDFDFSAVYGPQWKFLRESSPCSVVFAVGSTVAVYPIGNSATANARQTLAERADSAL